MKEEKEKELNHNEELPEELPEKSSDGESKKSPKMRVKSYVTVNLPKMESLPHIKGGVCEFCGISYKNCPHYKGIDIMCSFCLRNDKTITESRDLLVKKINNDTLEICCDDYKCMDKWNNKYRPKI